MSETISEAEAMLDSADYIDAGSRFFRDTRKPTKTVNGNTFYRCTRCGQYMPKSEFYKDKRVPCGIRDKCKKCYHRPKRKDI